MATSGICQLKVEKNDQKQSESKPKSCRMDGLT